MKEVEAPKRAYSIEIEVGADTKQDLIGQIKEIIRRLEEGSIQGVTGGYSVGSHFKLTVDENMTHDKYFEQNERWLEKNRTVV